MKRLLFIFIIISLIPACAHVVSRETREIVDMEIKTIELFQNPDAYIGKNVILGGFIVNTTNTDTGSYIEVVQNPLDNRGIPVDRDISYGRFIILHNGVIDTAIFSEGRQVTVAGEVVGIKIKPLGEIQYSYLLIKSKEIHLISSPSRSPVHFGIGIGAAF